MEKKKITKQQAQEMALLKAISESNIATLKASKKKTPAKKKTK